MRRLASAPVVGVLAALLLVPALAFADGWVPFHSEDTAHGPLSYSYIPADSNRIEVGIGIGCSTCTVDVTLDGVVVMHATYNQRSAYEFTGDHVSTSALHFQPADLSYPYSVSVLGANTPVNGQYPAGHWASPSLIIPSSWTFDVVWGAVWDTINAAGLFHDLFVYIIAFGLVIVLLRSIKRIAYNLALGDVKPDNSGTSGDAADSTKNIGTPGAGTGPVGYLDAQPETKGRKRGGYGID